MSRETLYYTSNKTRYAYQVSGEGPPVVMLHGFTGSQATWEKVSEKLNKNFQVITIDLPGHGETKFNKPLSMEACCEDLVQLFTYLKITHIHLVGYSMGGRLALTFSMLYPHWLASLTLESASPGLRLESERKARREQDEQLAKRIEREGVKSFVSFWEDIPLFESQKRLPLEVQQSVRKERLSQSIHGLASSLRFMGTGQQPSWWDRLQKLLIPVLLLVGGRDDKFVQINKDMDRYLPSGQLIIIDQAGHAVHIEHPHTFSEHVSHFILSK